jgi:hypothetical protein
MSSGLLQPGPSRGTWTAEGLNGETGVVDGSATGLLFYHPARADGKGRRDPSSDRSTQPIM